MLEGTHAVFEVGLALLRMQQEELLQYDSEVDVVVHIRKHTKELYNPKKLLAHVCYSSPECYVESVAHNIH